MREEGGFSTGSMLLSFVLGGVVGAAVALLLAPQSGRETRQRIRNFTDDVKDRAKEYAGGMREKVTSSYVRGKDFLEDKKSAITKAVEAGKEAYEKEKEKLSAE